MIDEWCERQIDKLCEAAPAYFSPRMRWFCGTRFGWRMTLYAAAFKRRVVDPVVHFEWMEKEKPPEQMQIDEFRPNPQYAKLDPNLRRDVEAWDKEQKDLEAQREQERKKWITPVQWLKARWAGRHEWERRNDERWAKREAEAIKRAQERMKKRLPMMNAIRKSRFPVMLFLTMFSALGVCAAGSSASGFAAAACCAMWLSVAVDTGYTPVVGNVTQPYLMQLFLRALSHVLLLAMYFTGYARQGVQSNVLLQSAMVILLLAHAVLFLALVAFNRRQPLFLRALTGVLGVIPALMAAAAIALAMTRLASPPVTLGFAMAGCAGALMEFWADRLDMITDLGGIRLRYTPIWSGLLLEAGYLLMIHGAWIAG